MILLLDASRDEIELRDGRTDVKKLKVKMNAEGFD